MIEIYLKSINESIKKPYEIMIYRMSNLFDNLLIRFEIYRNGTGQET